MEDLDRQFPNWRQEDHIWSNFQLYNPATHILVAFVIDLGETEIFPSIARFGRWNPCGVYCLEDELLKGQLVLSSSGPACVESQVHLRASSTAFLEDVCANVACETRVSAKVPQLKLCGRCKAVRYCSVDCQKADYGAHKVHCIPHQTMGELSISPRDHSHRYAHYTEDVEKGRLYHMLVSALFAVIFGSNVSPTSCIKKYNCLTPWQSLTATPATVANAAPAEAASHSRLTRATSKLHSRIDHALDP